MTQSEIKSIEFAAYIGIDWADQKHDICLQEADSKQIESLRLDHKPDSISNWVSELRQRFQGKPAAIALEQKRGGIMKLVERTPRLSKFGKTVLLVAVLSLLTASSAVAAIYSLHIEQRAEATNPMDGET